MADRKGTQSGMAAMKKESSKKCPIPAKIKRVANKYSAIFFMNLI